MEQKYQCNSCEQPVEPNWKYCRYCGTAQPKRQPIEVESSIKAEPLTIEEHIEFDKDLYYSVLSTRTNRKSLIDKKEELAGEINSLLDQLQSGLVTREYAMPKIKKIKEQVSLISEKQEEYKGIPESLPVETLNDEIAAANERLKKIDKLEEDENISKETILEAKQRSQQSLDLLKNQQSKIFGHIRNWKAELKETIKENRKEIEHLYVRFKTGELTEETYNERKKNMVEETATKERVVEAINKILDD